MSSHIYAQLYKHLQRHLALGDTFVFLWNLYGIAVIRELVETEEEFGKDLKFVVEKYLKPLEDHLRGAHITPSSSSASVGSSSAPSTIPRLVRDHKDVIFGNFMQISEFHNGVLIEGFKYYANEPKMLGRTFLRLERDFDKHVAYCRDEPKAQEFLDEHEEVKEYFDASTFRECP
ncbi:hypothetical protein J437_LFUL013761 [Ladona fulva]|uniref:DH domain-containing protein n=1 Tax=Ladona fulva TaxID=123851 RepID=A0A8K0KG19_LADFU|nr:hypothetical protein J437_LFUL013761 [Ladona fulva]